jgi:hypothetical protein
MTTVNDNDANVSTRIWERYTKDELNALKTRIEELRLEWSPTETEMEYILAEVPNHDKEWSPPQWKLQSELWKDLERIWPVQGFHRAKDAAQRHLLKPRKKITPELVDGHNWKTIKRTLFQYPEYGEHDALATLEVDLRAAFAKGIPQDSCHSILW